MSRAKILRRGEMVGELDCATGELTSDDAVLNELWAYWQANGFNVLGPPPEEPPAGTLADGIYNIKPGRGNMALVVIELGNNGYELQLEETPIATTTPKPVFGRPADCSYAAYRAFIREMTATLGGEGNATEKELREGWRLFWRTDDPEGGA